MAQTGKQKGCCGTFALGSYGVASDPALQCFADCCKVCPPDCCDEATLIFRCGDPWDKPCDCSPTPATMTSERSPTETEFAQDLYPTSNEETDYYFPGDDLIELPGFEQEDGTILRAFSFGPGSCPCEDITVTVTTGWCCFVVGGAGGTQVGDGTVSASGGGGCGNGCGDVYVIKVSANGGPWQVGGAAVSDGDSFSVGIFMEGDSDCSCSCCLIQTIDPCAPYSAEMFRSTPTHSGLTLKVDQQALLRRAESLSRVKKHLREAKRRAINQRRRIIKRKARVVHKKEGKIF